MSNFYSSVEYLELCEVPHAKLINVEVDIGLDESIIVSGIRLDERVAFGIHAPFWYPSGIEEMSFERLGKFSDGLFVNSFEDGIREVCLRLPPHSSENQVDNFIYHLVRVGFRIKDVGVWQGIDVSKYANCKEYYSSLRHSGRKTLRRFEEVYSSKAHESDLSEGEISDVYRLIQANRKRLGTTLKYSLAYLITLVKTFPDQINLFTLCVNDQTVAAAICHKTDPYSLYVAAWGDYGHELKYSPMYKFAGELVNYCIESGISNLEFGLSSDTGLYTPKLYDFKRNIGCIARNQYTLIAQR